MQRSEAEALATAALERFRHMHLYADRKLIAAGRHVVAARCLHRRARHGVISSIVVGGFMLVNGLANMGVGDGFARTLGLTTTVLWGLMGLGLVIGATWQHGRTRELVSQVEALLPEQAEPARAVAAT